MKIKRLVGLVAALVMSLAVIATIPTAKQAHAEDNAPIFYCGYEYNAKYVANAVKDAYGIDLNSDYTYYYDCKNVSDDAWLGEKTMTSGTIKFNAYGEYEIVYYRKDGDSKLYVAEGAESEDIDNAIKYKVSSENVLGKTSIAYSFTAEDLADYQNEINSKLENKLINAEGDEGRFEYPSLEKYLKSNCFEYDDLTFTVYYATRGSSSYTSTTNDYFTLNTIGRYEYYVLASDPTYNSTTKEGLSMSIDEDAYTLKTLNGVYGWYANENDELYVPVFSFEVSDIQTPHITISNSSKKAHVGITYTCKDIDIIATNESTDYKLYYSASRLESDNWASAGISVLEAAVKAGNAKDVTDDEKVNFKSSSCSFMPTEEGYYYITVRVVDDKGANDQAITYPIAAKDDVTYVTYEFNFFKDNLLSVIFLGIAVACAIALVAVLIFVKPKEESEDNEVKKA